MSIESSHRSDQRTDR